MICKTWDVVTVPFPFTDRGAEKRRPAVVLSTDAFNRVGFTILAMITTSNTPWPNDTPLQDLPSAGLHSPCVIRSKIFTLDNRLILRQVGHLAETDQLNAAKALKDVLRF